MLDFLIKYDMEKYAHSLKEKVKTAGLEEAIEVALTGRPKAPAKTPEIPLSKHQHEHGHGQAYKHEHVEHRVTSPYGERIHPVTKKRRVHKGIDLGGREGTPVYAYDDGVVTAVSSAKVSGNFVVIKHEEEDMTSSYSHLSEQLVQKGQKVRKGDKIGLVGSTGMATGPHLHFRLKYKGQDVDPGLFITDRRIVG